MSPRLEPNGDPDFRSASGDDTVDYQVNAQGTEITRTTPSGKSTRTLLSHAGFPLKKWVQGLLAATWIWTADGHLDQSTTGRTATDHHRDAFGHDAGASFSTTDSAVVPTPAIALTNDRLGRPLEITDGSGRREMDHEGLREISQTWTGDGHAPPGASLAGFELRRVFSPADGRLTGLQVHRGGSTVHAVTFARDAHGRIHSVGDNHGGGGAYTAFIPGTSMPLALDRPGPGDTTWAYDQERRLDSLATGGFGFDLQYNAGGLISRVIPSTGTSTAFSYNARRELSGADGPQTFAYGYDGSGNRVSATLPVAALGGSGSVQVSLVYQPDALHGYQAVGSATSGTPESLHLVRVQGTINRTAPVRLQVRADGDLLFDQLLPPQPENLFEVEIPLRNLAATARTVTLAVTGILPGGAANGRDAVARLDETVILPALDVLARGGIEDRAYDADGNLTSDGTWSYAWNGRNQLAAMERPRESLAFEYNAEGMRTFKRHRRTDAEGAVTERSHRFVWDGAMLLVEEITETLPDAPPQTWNRTYTWGLDLSGSVGGAGGTGGLLSIHDSRLGQTVLPVSNHRGDVVALLSPNGATVAQWNFGPFGEPLPGSGDPAWLDACRIGFGSKYTDPETGLVYFGYRYYDPRHGRWLGREPLGEEESFNPYAYCHNDPVNHYDFLGLEKRAQFIYDQHGNAIGFEWVYVFPGDVGTSHVLPDVEDLLRWRAGDISLLEDHDDLANLFIRTVTEEATQKFPFGRLTPPQIRELFDRGYIGPNALPAGGVAWSSSGTPMTAVWVEEEGGVFVPTTNGEVYDFLLYEGSMALIPLPTKFPGMATAVRRSIAGMAFRHRAASEASGLFTNPFRWNAEALHAVDQKVLSLSAEVDEMFAAFGRGNIDLADGGYRIIHPGNDQILINKDVGDAFRDQIAARFAANRFVGKVQTEFPIQTPGGLRKIDVRVTLKSGRILHLETKAGNSAIDPLQQAKDIWIQKTLGIRSVIVRQR